MRTFIAAAFACAAFVGGTGTAAAQSAPEFLTVSGSICKPAGAAASTGFVSKATGGRNESTSAGVFVICPFVITPTPTEGGAISSINVALYSVDGAAHDVTCTAVIGSMNRPIVPTYSSKTTEVPGDAAGGVATWTAADFGGTAGAGIIGSAWTTVTCLLPPQTAVELISAQYKPQSPPQQ